MIPARRATSQTLPLVNWPSRTRCQVPGDMRTLPLARAVRVLSSLADVSTIRLAPAASKWVNDILASEQVRHEAARVLRDQPVVLADADAAGVAVDQPATNDGRVALEPAGGLK